MKQVGLLLAVYGLSVSWIYPAQLPKVHEVEPQPFVAQVVRLSEALNFLGSSLRPDDLRRIQRLRDEAPTASVVIRLQEILDPYCLAMVDINPEARVKVIRGPAKAQLMQGGWTSFLVKVHNAAAVNSALVVESPNALPSLHRSTSAKRMKTEHAISEGDLASRFLELSLFRRRPLQASLTGLQLEYVLLQAYSRDEGLREAKIGFHVGQGTQDIGFRNAIHVLFSCLPAVPVTLRVKDHDGSPTMASFIITDGIERIAQDPETNPLPADYRHALALKQPWDKTRGIGDTPVQVGRLVGVYPLPSRRLARGDDPDFFFHPQIYRADGEKVKLPPGSYEVQFGRGPEYLPLRKRLIVPENVEAYEASFELKRWVNMASLGWRSADHHVHAAGCSHYESPDEGVRPEHMWRQVLGEDLNIACVLTWGPCWYHQKQFFEGKVHRLSGRDNLMRYDVEVSGFPSSHAGHLCLLRLKEDDYPGASRVEEWPSWTLPILQWAQSQGGLAGYSHSGWGLEPLQPPPMNFPTTRCPSSTVSGPTSSSSPSPTMPWISYRQAIPLYPGS